VFGVNWVTPRTGFKQRNARIVLEGDKYLLSLREGRKISLDHYLD
jgi:hypothetical protein